MTLEAHIFWYRGALNIKILSIDRSRLRLLNDDIYIQHSHREQKKWSTKVGWVGALKRAITVYSMKKIYLTWTSSSSCASDFCSWSLLFTICKSSVIFSDDDKVLAFWFFESTVSSSGITGGSSEKWKYYPGRFTCDK